MANLRRALGGEFVGRSGGGYALAVPAEQVDALCFERLLGDGRAVEALALWRGEPLAGIEGDWAEGERRRLCDLHLEAREKSLAARLEVGGGGELVGQLQTLVVDEPLRERPRELLMRALYRAGRQADALEVYRQTRSLFDSELGIEPSPQLRELERSILTHDSGLAAPAQNRKRRWLLLAVPAIVLAAAAVSFAWSTRDRTPVYHAPANSAVRIDPRSGHVSTATVVGRLPGAVAVGAGSVWIANRGDDTISRLDRSGQVERRCATRRTADGARVRGRRALGDHRHRRRAAEDRPGIQPSRQDTQASRRAAAPVRRPKLASARSPPVPAESGSVASASRRSPAGDAS